MFARRTPLLAVAALLLMPACSPVQESKPVAEEATPTPEGATSYALFAPIPANQMNRWTSMIEQMKSRAEVHTASNEAAGVSKELIFLQDTPQGAGAAVYFEGKDLGAMMGKRSAAQDEHTKWFVSEISTIHSLPEDLSVMPANEMVLQGDVTGVEGQMQPYVLGVPVLPGQEAAHLALCAELTGARRAAWEESRRARGIKKEYAWHQKNPDGSTTAVIYIEFTDLTSLNAPATTDFEKWFREQLLLIHGIPVDAPMPANTLIASF